MKNKNQNQNISVFIALFAVIFIDSMGMSMAFTLFAPLFSTGPFSILSPTITSVMRDTLYGICLGVYPAMMFFGAPILGDLSDQIGRKKVLIVCLIGEAVGMLICAIAVTQHSIVGLIIGRIIAGLMAASLVTAQAAIIDISDDQHKMINISLITFANSAGWVIGPMISGYLADDHLVRWFGLSMPFYMTATIAVINALMIIKVFKETFVTKAKKSIHLFKGCSNLIEAYKNKTIRAIAGIYFFNVLGWILYFQLIGLYLINVYHYSPAQLGYFISWISVMMSLAMLVIVRLLLKRFKPKQILLMALLTAILGIFISLIPSLKALWIAAIPIPIGVGLIYSSVLTLLSNSVSESHQGWIMGIAASVMAIASTSSSVVTSIVTGRSYQLTFIFIAFFWVISFLIFLKTKINDEGK